MDTSCGNKDPEKLYTLLEGPSSSNTASVWFSQRNIFAAALVSSLVLVVVYLPALVACYVYLPAVISALMGITACGAWLFERELAASHGEFLVTLLGLHGFH